MRVRCAAEGEASSKKGPEGAAWGEGSESLTPLTPLPLFPGTSLVHGIR